MSDPSLSIVVMGYDNATTIVEAIRSVLGQTGEGPFDVVVVTSGGDDSPSRIRTAFPEVKVVHSPVRLMPGAARNAGIAATTGSHVAFLAADCVAAPGWILGRQRAHAMGHRAVAGAMGAGDASRPAELASHFLLFAGRLPGRGAGLVEWPDPAAHGLSIERALLEELGPYDEIARGGEDTAAAARLRALGVPIWFEPSVKTIHRGPRNVTELVKDEFRRGRLQVQASAPPRYARAPLAGMMPLEAGNLIGALWTEASRSWRYARSRRLALIAFAPWILAGAAARRLGRLRALADGEAGTAVAAMGPGLQPQGSATDAASRRNQTPSRGTKPREGSTVRNLAPSSSVKYE